MVVNFSLLERRRRGNVDKAVHSYGIALRQCFDQGLTIENFGEEWVSEEIIDNLSQAH